MSGAISLLSSITFLAAWGTALVMSALTSQFGMLMLSLFIPPAGAVYGVGIWFGVW